MLGTLRVAGIFWYPVDTIHPLCRNGRRQEVGDANCRGAAFTQVTQHNLLHSRERESGSNLPITVRFWFLHDALAFSLYRCTGAVWSWTKYFYRGLTFGGTARTHKKRSGVQQRCVWSWAWLQGAFQPQCLTNR